MPGRFEGGGGDSEVGNKALEWIRKGPELIEHF